MNHTFHGLIRAGVVSRSPFLSQSLHSSSSLTKFHSFHFSRSFSSFYFTTSSRPQFEIISSSFSDFLETVIRVQDAVSYSNLDIVSRTNTPLSYSGNESITISSSNFSHNSNDFVGGALWIFTKTAITVTIQDSTFMNNTASFGGAIMMLAPEGSLVMNGFCYFDNNTATGQGSHICLIAVGCDINNAIFMNSTGTSSIYMSSPEPATTTTTSLIQNSLETIIEARNIELLEDSFAQSHPNYPAKISFVSRSDSGNSHFPIQRNANSLGLQATPAFNFIFTKFFENGGQVFIKQGAMDGCCLFMSKTAPVEFFMAGSSVTIQNSCVNIIQYPAGPDPATVTAYWTDSGNPSCFMCQVIPTPSITINGRWDMRESILSLVGLCVFALLSILGIVFVSVGCIKKKARPEDNELMNERLADDDDEY